MDETRAQSEFNMAVSYLNRLNALFYAADDAAMSLDMHGWYHAVMGIYRELSTEMKDDEIKEMDTFANKVHELMVENDKRNQRFKRQEVSAEVYQKMHEFEMKVRKILKQAGLQNKLVENALHALK